MTAVLFLAGKWVFGLYNLRSDVGDAHDVAGVLIVLLTWVYDASVIVPMGAELFQELRAPDSECTTSEEPTGN